MPTQTLDNGIYSVAVEDGPGLSIGSFSMKTGVNHPVGQDFVLLLSTYNTIRSYTSMTDYVQTSIDFQATDPGYTVQSISTAATVLPQTPTNSTIVYNLAAPSYPDNMSIVQDITVYGTNINDSRVAITTLITNTGTGPLVVGLRYFWDLGIDGDDGPTFQALNPDGPVLITEATFDFPNFEAYQLENNQGSPTIQLMGTVNGPAAINPPPVAPDKLQYASWNTSAGQAFSYSTAGANNTDDDSALLTFWGGSQENAIELLPGQTATLRTLFFNNTQGSSRGVDYRKIV